MTAKDWVLEQWPDIADVPELADTLAALQRFNPNLPAHVEKPDPYQTDRQKEDHDRRINAMRQHHNLMKKLQPTREQKAWSRYQQKLDKQAIEDSLKRKKDASE